MPDVTLRLNIIETASDWVLVCQSSQGGTTTHVPAPFTADELGRTLHDLETAMIRSSSKLVTRRAASPERAALEFGQRLSNVLMAGHTREIFDRCRIRARQDRSTLRLLLHTDGPSVSRIPWEFALDPQANDYLALRLSLARALHIAEPTQPLSVDLPLRVLGVESHPHDLPQLDIDQERRNIAQAFASLSSDLVDVVWLAGDRWSDLRKALRDAPWHVLHFIGHGGFDHDLGAGYLELSDDEGAAKRVVASDLGRTLSDSHELRLVVLNACESATSGSSDVLASTAATVMREGIPAVVAMQYEITDPAALAFSAAFYEAVARGVSVDRAVTTAREIVKVKLGSLEWATPVLFLASDEARIFDVSEAMSSRTIDKPSVTSTTAAPSPGASPRRSSGWYAQFENKLNQYLNKGDEHVQPHLGDDLEAAQPTAVSSASVDPMATTARTPRLQSLATTRPLGAVRAMALGPRDLVAAACSDAHLRVWSSVSNRLVAKCQLPDGASPRRVAWSPWPRHVATANDDTSVVVWDLETEVPLRILRPNVQRIQSVAFSANGRWIAIAGDNRSILVFDPQGVEVARFRLGTLATPAPQWFGSVPDLGPLAFAPGDRHLVVATNDGMLSKVDVHGVVTSTWPHPQEVTAIATGRDRLATSSVDGRLRIWTWEGGLVFKGDEGPRADYLTMQPSNAYFAMAADDGKLVVRSPAGRLLGEGALAGTPVGIGVGSGGPVTVTADGVIQRWSTETSDRERTSSA